MEGRQQPVQVLVDRISGWIVAYGSFPDGTSDPSQYVVALPEDRVPILNQPGQKVWNPDTQTITVANLPPPPPIVIYNDVQTINDIRLRTLQAAPVEVWRLNIPPQSGHILNIEWIAVDAGNGAIKTQHTRATIERINAGPLLIGRTDDPPHATTGSAATAAGVASWTMSAVFDTTQGKNDLVLSAVGANNRTIDWLLTGSIRRFGPGGLP